MNNIKLYIAGHRWLVGSAVNKKIKIFAINLINLSKWAEEVYNIAVILDYFCETQPDKEECYNLAPVVKYLHREADLLNAFFIDHETISEMNENELLTEYNHLRQETLSKTVSKDIKAENIRQMKKIEQTLSQKGLKIEQGKLGKIVQEPKTESQTQLNQTSNYFIANIINLLLKIGFLEKKNMEIEEKSQS